MTGRLFIFGLGFSGLEIAKLAKAAGWQVAGTCRTAEKAERLRRQGFEADVAASGHEGLALAKANAYDVIFMDLEMPEMDGFATTELIRASETGGRRVPIIAITGLTIKGTREKCLQSGMDDYLTKPVYLPALRSALEIVLPPEKRSSPAKANQDLTLSV